MARDKAKRYGTERYGAERYPVRLEQEEDGGYVATLPDIGYGATQGDTLQEALALAEDMLEEAVLGTMAHGEEVPLPSRAQGGPTVALPALTAAKLEAYRAMRAAGLNKKQLAERLGWQPSQVTRLFDGRHASRLEQIEAALKALGRRLVVSSESG
jgi:antitoxin HicB